jgi:hypothetical protein
MTTYEYRVVPAPQRGLKVKGARTTEARFAQALMALMNELGRDGWEYLRADTLPCEERVGLTGRTTRFQNMLVFRRAVAVETAAAAPEAPRTADLPQVEPPVTTPPAARPGVAERLAATLTNRPPPPAGPPRLVAVQPDAGRAPTLGAARGQGLANGDIRERPAE